MNEPAKRLLELLDAAGAARSAPYARLRVADLPGSRTALAYFDLGDPRGAPLLCLHGLSISGLCFDHFHAHFFDSGIRAIAPCLLGGIYLPNPARTIAHVTSELIELMDVLEVQRFDVLGFSWGTLPQLALVARAADRIGRAGLVGPMLPTRFLGARDLDRLKSDIRVSLALVRRAPALHRSLMWLVSRLPASALLGQFEDANLSPDERAALAEGSPFRSAFTRWIDECRRTGSGFFTEGWRMMLDEPDYRLSDLAQAAQQVEMRMYIGERDNVHLPLFALRIAAAHRGIDVAALRRLDPLPSPDAGRHNEVAVFRPVYSEGRSHILSAPGAGRMACMLYLQQALDDLMIGDRARRLAHGASIS